MKNNRIVRKVVLAFDSFKGCLSAQEACAAVAEGVRAVADKGVLAAAEEERPVAEGERPVTAEERRTTTEERRATAEEVRRVTPDVEIVELPLSDGGEGLVACVKQLLPTSEVRLMVHGPLMEPIACSYALSADGKTAYMEMAAASGLTLVPEEKRNPLLTTTYGVGEMLVDAMGRGCESIVMGIGGSATCDAGEGMLKALWQAGYQQPSCRILVACDVDNPLYGVNGAAYVFAPQKGATPEQVALLDARLRHFAKQTEEAGIASTAMAHYPGAGAAGGLGYALLTYLHAELQSGIEIILNLAEFDTLIQDADLVITGEGKSDAQTMMGKVPCGVLKRCRQVGATCWLLSGAIDDSEGVLSGHFDIVKSINEGDTRPLSQLLLPEVAQENLRQTVQRLLKT